MTDKSRIVAVAPMKPLAESKTRLSDSLSPAQRATLSLSMLSWALRALRLSKVSRAIVIGGDEQVMSASRREGAEWIQDEFLDLNGAVGYVFDMVWRDGLSAIYVPADLPLLTHSDIDSAIELSENGRFLTICRAHDGGTNCVIAPPDVGFRTLLGSDSFRRHVELANELNLEWRQHDSTGFRYDVDTVSDLRFCMEKRPQCLSEISDAIGEVRA